MVLRELAVGASQSMSVELASEPESVKSE